MLKNQLPKYRQVYHDEEGEEIDINPLDVNINL